MPETAARPACFYRPRRVRDSPLYRLAEEHFETFKQVYDDRFASRYGFWRAEVERTLLAFLDCGLPERGFARIRCPSCRHEFLLAFSCKARGYCMSCHAKRAALWAEHLAERVLLPVPHEQWVFTLPKRLRLFFLYDRTLLGDLARCAWGTVRDLYLAGRPERTAVPGLVASVQTYGDLANWQPHIHALVTSGLIDPDGEFTPLDRPPAGVAEELFRRRVLKMLVGCGKLDEDSAAGLLAWQHSGFSVHNTIRVEAEDAAGVERLCRYLVHPPIALDRLEVPGASRPCTYRGRRPHPVTGEQTVTLDPLEMLARLCQHIPSPRLHLTRLYGAYASRTRASRARRCTPTMGASDTTAGHGAPEPEPLTAFLRERRRAWARLIKKVFEADPLACPNCWAAMKVVAFIVDPPVIRKILEHLKGLAHGPPRTTTAPAAN